MPHTMMKMRVQRGLSTARVMQMIENALRKEKQQWAPHLYTKGILREQVEEVDGQQRDYVVNWLSNINDGLRLAPENFFLAATLLDEFLDVVRARPKYLQCIAVVCFFLSIKVMEEEESIPTTHELVTFTKCGCSIAEVLRMEKIILTKLSWDVARITAVDFAHLLHTLLLLNSRCGSSPNGMPMKRNGGLLRSVISKLKWFTTFHEVLVFRPSVLALAVVTLELEKRTREWFILTVALQRAMQADNAELIRCREMLFHVTESSCSTKNDQSYLLKFANQISGMSTPLMFKPGKRKIEQTNVEDIYDSIKRLYAEEGSAPLLTSCEDNQVSSFKNKSHHALCV